MISVDYPSSVYPTSLNRTVAIGSPLQPAQRASVDLSTPESSQSTKNSSESVAVSNSVGHKKSNTGLTKEEAIAIYRQIAQYL